MAAVLQPVSAPFRNRTTWGTVAGVAVRATSAPVADEAALAQRAAAGDGDAFATLYESYEGRVYNLCIRILGSQDDAADAAQEAFVNVLRRLPKFEGRELAFGSYVFTSARNACYDLIERRRRTEPSDELPEHATPVGAGVGGGGMGYDPGDPEDDPERNVLLDARTEEIRHANLALPERQREALALKELEDLSYDEVAEVMGMNRNSVAQLISRARINLRDALRGAALGAIIPNSPQCERAMPLIASLDDGELPPDSADGDWLTDHLVGCEVCRARREAMEEAGVSYRAWLPIAAGPFLFRETMAEAAELVGADWSDVVARRESARGGLWARRGRRSGSCGRGRHRRRPRGDPAPPASRSRSHGSARAGARAGRVRGCHERRHCPRQPRARRRRGAAGARRRGSRRRTGQEDRRQGQEEAVRRQGRCSCGGRTPG